MEFSLILTLILASAIGITLGLLGGGGAILAVPILTYVTGLEPVVAIPTSLFIVGVTSLVSLGLHARRGRVQWRVGLTFGLAAMAGAFVGGRVGVQVPGVVLMLAFAAVMALAGIAMIRGRRELAEVAAESPRPKLGLMLATGAGVGLISGFVGAGGGFLIVPALAMLARLPMRQAVATSLLVITMQSTAGLGGYALASAIDWGLAVAVAGIAAAGSLLGFWLSSRIPAARLKRLFGYFVLVIAAVVLGVEVLGVFGVAG